MHSPIIATTLLTLALLISATPISRRQNNLQSFTGAIGGEAATPIVDSCNADRPFQVGQDTFVNIAAALQRSCDQQFNRCANLANGGDDSVSVGECQAQKQQCDGAGAAGGAAAGNGNGNANANGNGNGNAVQNNNAAAGNGNGACKAKKS